MVNPKQIIIGTRTSPLALWQATWVQQQIEYISQGQVQVILHKITTKGDKILDKALDLVGGKGLFTEEINDLLLRGDIHIAVHSMKDLETFLPQDLAILAVPKREDPRDAFLSPQAASLHELPPNAVIGTASLRRAAQCQYYRPDCDITLLRGNVGTRLQKLADGVVDATFLAIAGLNRLHMNDKARAILDIDEFVPAIGQGALAIVGRDDNHVVRDMLKPIHHLRTHQQITIERYLLALVNGSCHTPIGAHAFIDSHNDHVTLHSFYQHDGDNNYYKDSFSLSDYKDNIEHIAKRLTHTL